MVVFNIRVASSDSRGEADVELGECWLAGRCGEKASLLSSSKLYTSEVSGVFARSTLLPPVAQDQKISKHWLLFISRINKNNPNRAKISDYSLEM